MHTSKVTPILEIVHGGPGNGKTFLMFVIVEKFRIEQLKYNLQDSIDRILIAAPTAIASQLYETGTTIHSIAGVCQDTMIKSTTFTRGSDLLEATVLILDEMSMIVDSLLEQLFQRLCQCRNVEPNGDPFAGLSCVILIGDFTQLPPGIGGAKKGIMGMMLNPVSRLARHLQQDFHATFLLEQERGKGCDWQTELVTNIFRCKSSSSIYPITKQLMRTTCDLCEAANKPTEGCRHFHTLSKNDFINDPSWYLARQIFITWDAAWAVAVKRMSQFAALNNTCVLRWRLPCYTAKGDNAELYAALPDSIINSIPQLWGYYVPGLPCRIDHNISQYARVCNGSQVTLTSIVPSHPQV